MSSVDKPTPDFSLDQFWDEVLEPDIEIYTGPEAFTIRMLAEKKERSDTTIRRRIQQALEEGRIVGVKVEKPGYGPVNAYVRTEVYEAWKEREGSKKDDLTKPVQ